jgi:hypothetical protein
VLILGLAEGDQTLVERALSAFGAEIETMRPSAEFVNAVRARHPHLLVAYAGPAGENLRFIFAMKSDALAASVPVLLLTDVPVRETGAQAPEEVLPLPLDPQALRDRLSRFLG